jgi:hypothetical protein
MRRDRSEERAFGIFAFDMEEFYPVWRLAAVVAVP